MLMMSILIHRWVSNVNVKVREYPRTPVYDTDDDFLMKGMMIMIVSMMILLMTMIDLFDDEYGRVSNVNVKV